VQNDEARRQADPVNLKLSLVAASQRMTWFLGMRFPDAVPLVFVVGYPKSGTTWACQLVADYLRLPNPRWSLLPVACAAAVQGHEPVRKRYQKAVYALRDGRDVLVSQYFFHARFIPEGDHPRLPARLRRIYPGLVNKADVGRNFAPFLERQMTKPESSRLNWAEHVRSYFEIRNPNVVLLRYEALLAAGAKTLAEAMASLTGEEPDLERASDTLKRFSFQTLAGRPSGHEDRRAFLRKGQAGDWVNHFTREAAEIFDHYCGEMLITAGYERDHAWVQTCPRAADYPVPSASRLATGERS